MPVYEYDCADCRARFEIRASDPLPPSALRCPDCDGPRIGRYYGSVTLRASSRGAAPAASPAGEPAAGELRTTDPGALTRSVARQYAAGTGDRALAEVARRAERGDGPAELHELVREIKSEGASAPTTSRTRKPAAAKAPDGGVK